MLARLWRERDGSIGIVAAGASAMMVAAGALAVDASHLYVAQNKLQTTVDEVALTAAQRLSSDPEEARRQARRMARLILGIDDEEELDELTTITFGQWDPEQRVFTAGDVATGAVSVTGRQDVPMYFATLLGFKSIAIEASAVARTGGVDSTCLLVLDPGASAALYLDSNAEITARDCDVVVDSSHARALTADSNSLLRSARTLVAGGVRGPSKHFDPQPLTGAVPLDDPLAHRAAPDVPGCTYTNRRVKDTTTVLLPGVYCGGLEIDGNARVTLQAGVYVMKDGPLALYSNVRVTGEGVGFYFTGSNAVIDFDSNVAVDLTAPQDGPLAGILFFEDRAAPLLRTHELNSNSVGRLEGAIYLSRGRLSLDSNSTIAAASAFTDVIVRQLQMNSNAHLVLNANYATTEVPRAISASRPVLVN